MHLAALGANRRRSPWLGKTGRPTDPPLDRRTGEGRVDATPGHYRDALAKGNIVHAPARHIVHRGALSPPVILLLKTLAKVTQGTTGHDSTQYGLGRASPHARTHATGHERTNRTHTTTPRGGAGEGKKSSGWAEPSIQVAFVLHSRRPRKLGRPAAQERESSAPRPSTRKLSGQAVYAARFSLF